MAENNMTKAWQLYEEGRRYNQRLTPDQYQLVETNTEFFAGNQWLHLPDTPAMRGLPKPTFNILKRVASLFIASLTSSGIALRYEPLTFYGGGKTGNHTGTAEFTNAAVNDLLEKLKFDYRVREALFDGAQTGDYCAHFWFDPDKRPYGGAFGQHRGEIRMELVDGINVMFGNPSNRTVQEQPYILLVGRDTVENLRWEAELFKKNRRRYKNGKANDTKSEHMDFSIVPDAENDLMPGMGGKVELTAEEETGKALYVLLYTKVTREETERNESGAPVYTDVYDEEGNPVYERDENGNPVLDAAGQAVIKRKKVKRLVTTVYATKATRTGVIYEDVDTGLSLYPVAWGNWEKQRGQYHGRALVTGLIPNQIFINSMFATAMRHMQLMAFPKTVYNADLISRWSNEVGQAVAVHGLQPGQGIAQVAANLQPAEMSNQIFTLIDKAMAYTKECLGATDAQMGNVKPDNTSALMVLQTNSEVPLENIRAGLYEWVEDIGAILPDMMGTYYGRRPIVVEQEVEELVTEGKNGVQFDPETGRMATRKVRRKMVKEFDFSQLKHISLNLRIDVGATTYFSEIAMTQTLDNLRRDGTLDVIQYLERIPDKLIPRKQELLEQVKQRVRQDNAGAPAVPGTSGKKSMVSGVDQGGALSSEKILAQVPAGLQKRYGDMSPWEKRGLLQAVGRKNV